MKKQTFIAKIETADGAMVDFYRFGVKDASRIKRTMKDAAGREIFRRDWTRRGGQTVRLYATPDGYTETRPAVWAFEIADVPALGY